MLLFNSYIEQDISLVALPLMDGHERLLFMGKAFFDTRKNQSKHEGNDEKNDLIKTLPLTSYYASLLKLPSWAEHLLRTGRYQSGSLSRTVPDLCVIILPRDIELTDRRGSDHKYSALTPPTDFHLGRQYSSVPICWSGVCPRDAIGRCTHFDNKPRVGHKKDSS